MKKVLLISAASVFLFTSCSQSETRASFHQYGVGTGGGSLGYHTLRKGETLWAVAKAYNVDLRDMLDLNQFSVPYKTYPGERIRIPAPASYKVRRGDTLYKVSRMFETTTTDVARLNNIKTPYKLTEGQSLRLPPKYAQSQRVIPTYTQTASVGSVKSLKPIQQTNKNIEREELKPIVTAKTTEQKTIVRSNEENQYSVQPAIIQSTQELTGNVRFIKPVAGQIISGYGPKADGLHNDGINIKASHGDVIRAAEKGIVVYQGRQIEGYGNMVLIRHANGYLTAYAHMDKTLVKKGDKVTRGQGIGTVGSSGNVKTPQLHFEIRKGRNAIDPKTMINS